MYIEAQQSLGGLPIVMKVCAFTPAFFAETAGGHGLILLCFVEPALQ